MRLLLDTNVFLWAMDETERLGDHAALIADRANDVLVSAVSSWEIAIKYPTGKLRLTSAPERYVPDAIRRLGVRAVPIEHRQALAVAALPPLHRDPFDRLLVAQAMSLDAALVTGDKRLAAYPADTIVV